MPQQDPALPTPSASAPLAPPPRARLGAPARGPGDEAISLGAPSLGRLFTLWHQRRPRAAAATGRVVVLDARLSLPEAEALLAPTGQRALLIGPEGEILASTENEAPRLRGALCRSIDELPLDAADTARLHLAHNQIFGRTEAAPMPPMSHPAGEAPRPPCSRITLRSRSCGNGQPVLLQIALLPRPGAAFPLALLRAVEMQWPAGTDAMLAETFGADLRQTEVLRALATGESLAEIMAHQALSAAEIDELLYRLLRQSGTRCPEELLQVLFPLTDLLARSRPRPDQPPGPALAAAPTAPPPPLPSATFETLPPELLPAAGLPPPDPIPEQPAATRPEDSHISRWGARQTEWLEYGAPGGRPILYMHFCFGLIRWSARAIRAARHRGLRILVPLRPGYGASTPVPPGEDWRATVLQDYARFCDHLGLREVVVVTQGADLRLALALAEARPDLVGAVLGCAAQLPLAAPHQFERMGKWQRFVLRNARFAPEALPSVLKATFALHRTLGHEAMLRLINEGSMPDIAALDQAEIREAVLEGIRQAWSPDPEIGIRTMAAECRDAETDWSDLLQHTRLPVRLLQADQDGFSPLATLIELQPDFPHLDIRVLADTGQLLLYQRWPEVLDSLEDLARQLDHPPYTGGGAAPVPAAD